jgi:hypothetical protein
MKRPVPKRAPKQAPKRAPKKPVLLSGDNPQIAMADGDASVRAYLAAIPGWKKRASQQLDALIARTVPGVRKAVKWNSPMYGVADQGFFLSFHMFDRYIKVTFFRGTELTPPPPVPSKVAHTRYVHIDDKGFDEAQLADWIKQAASLPGWQPGKPM